MNKTTTRLATIGTVVVLGAFAIALAQHDSRQRARETESTQPQAGRGERQAPIPVSANVDISNPKTNRQASEFTESAERGEPIVRANNDTWPEEAGDLASGYDSQSVLTGFAAPADSESRVVPAMAVKSNDAGEGGRSLPTPPAWLDEPGGTAAGSAGQPTSTLPSLPPLPNAASPTGSAHGSLSDAAGENSADSSDAVRSRPDGGQDDSNSDSSLPRLPSAGVTESSSPQSATHTPAKYTIGDTDTSRDTAVSGSPGDTPTSTPDRPRTSSYGDTPGFEASASDGDTAGSAGRGRPHPDSAAGQPEDDESRSGGPQAMPAEGGNPSFDSDSRRLAGQGHRSEVSRMSDTQRGAIQPTDMAPASGRAIPSGPSLPANLSARHTADSRGLSDATSSGFGRPAADKDLGDAQHFGERTRGSSGEETTGGGAGNRSVPNSDGSATSLSDRQRAALVVEANGSLVRSQPGNRDLDGPQTPMLTIEKRAPEEIRVGKPATFLLTVRNAGNVTAHDVQVLDSVPRGVQFKEARPSIQPGENGELRWLLGKLEPGAERTITMQVVPQTQGEIGSVASVHFASLTSVRTVATLPQIEIAVEHDDQVTIRDSSRIVLNVSNSGTGAAEHLKIEADISPQLRHETGDSQLIAPVDRLRPGDSKRIALELAAVEPGMATAVIRAITEDGVQAEKEIDIEVLAPKLQAVIEGPSRRYLERQANYAIRVTNMGTAMATNLAFDIHLPAGLKYASTDIPQATYHPDRHTVSLDLLELSPGDTAPIRLTVLPVELGDQTIKMNVGADLDASAEAAASVRVDGLAELAYRIDQDNGTVEVGASSTYTVEIENVGNQSDRDIELTAEIPAGSKLLAVDAPVEHRVNDRQVTFGAIDELNPGERIRIRFEVQHSQAGNQVVRTQLTSVNWPVAVTKEEGTRVYDDRN
jgi:uncharacterized repeat protein (TIGR01451 family)